MCACHMTLVYLLCKVLACEGVASVYSLSPVRCQVPVG